MRSPWRRPPSCLAKLVCLPHKADVAARAGVGKASLYLRWPSKVELVADAIRRRSGVVPPVPDTGVPLAEDMRAFLYLFCGPSGRAGAPCTALAPNWPTTPNWPRCGAAVSPPPCFRLSNRSLRRPRGRAGRAASKR